MRLVGIIIRIYHDVRSPERQILQKTASYYRVESSELSNRLHEF